TLPSQPSTRGGHAHEKRIYPDLAAYIIIPTHISQSARIKANPDAYTAKVPHMAHPPRIKREPAAYPRPRLRTHSVQKQEGSRQPWTLPSQPSTRGDPTH
ncbi:hypothetical protein, partial [Lentibacillus saliphilus]|uniref:hypothetical protein n=1 Tax=Lentibacillus saliphilus TaxID=2737028 RepID=UPI001C304404